MSSLQTSKLPKTHVKPKNVTPELYESGSEDGIAGNTPAPSPPESVFINSSGDEKMDEVGNNNRIYVSR